MGKETRLASHLHPHPNANSASRRCLKLEMPCVEQFPSHQHKPELTLAWKSSWLGFSEHTEELDPLEIAASCACGAAALMAERRDPG